MEGINEKFNLIKTKANSSLLQRKEKIDSGCGNQIFRERERELILFRFSAVRTVGSQRSKKQSRSMRRGLRMDIDLVEF